MFLPRSILMPKGSDKIAQAVRDAYKKALQIVEEETPPDAHTNAKIVAAARLVYLLLEVDLDEE